MLNNNNNVLINNNIFYKKDNYIFIRLNYINPKDFKLLKKNLQNFNYSLAFFSKKNLRNFLLKNKIDNNHFFKEVKTSKIYYIYSIDLKETSVFFNEVHNVLNNSLKNSSYILLFTKFSDDYFRPFFFNKNLLKVLNLNNFAFIFYFLQLFLLLDFLLLFSYFQEI